MNNIGHSFVVNQISISKRFDTYLNIQKRKENILFRSSSSAENANLSFVQSEDLSSNKNLTINDRSFSVLPNRFITSIEDQIMEEVSGFTSETNLFLITDKFTVDISTQEQIPLFYRHQLSRELLTGETYNNIQILDQNFNPIITSLYVTEDEFIYSNLLNEFDSSTGLFTVFYVSFIVRKSNGTQELFIEILNNHPVFHEAEFEDIDPDTGLLSTDSKAYLLQQGIGNTFDITLPVDSNYGIRRTSNSRIEILSPENTNVNNPWFVKVRNGSFLNTGNTGIKKYYLAEFNAQSFIPFFPYKQIDETSFRVSTRIIKTTKDKIAFGDGFFPEVIVYKSDGSFKFAVTSNPERLGSQAFDANTSFSNSLLGKSKVGGNAIDSSIDSIVGSSIDTASGFIVLPTGFEISESDTVRTIYNYEETTYELTELNFNPLNSSEFISQKVSLVIKPESLGVTEDQTLYYLIVNEDGQVIDTDIDFTLSSLSDAPIEGYIASGLLWYGRDPDEVTWAPSGSLDFIDISTLEGNNNQDDILILGDIYVRNSIAPESLILNDIRVRGGGVIEPISSESKWYWDLASWDGKPYPGAAAIFVEVPDTLLSSGELTPDNIRDTVNRHLAFGIYPVIHTYNLYQPTVTGINYLPFGQIEFSWTEGPVNSNFAIYSSPIEDGDYTLISGDLSDTSYLISGMAESYFSVIGYPSGESYFSVNGPLSEFQLFER
jgi:hypothetical protein